METGLRARLLALTEAPGLWLPPEPGQELVAEEGFTLLVRGGSASVLRIALPPGETGLALERVAALLRERGLREAQWWVGETSAPAGLAAELRGLGLGPGEPAALTSYAIERRPDVRPGAEVRRAERFEEWLEALELDWAVFAVAPGERERRRAAASEAWALDRAQGATSTYLALLDGRPAGFARAVFTPEAGLLVGGATLPHARGRGVYGATVLARWDEAVARDVPRLAVSAGPLSAPLLERAGFERIGAIELLRQRL